MPKTHPIETCIGCGCQIGPLVRENKKQWEDFRVFVDERLTIAGNKHIDLLSPCMMFHEKADVVYFLCTGCCKSVLSQLLNRIIARYRKILFWNFDKIKRELKNDDKNKFLWELPKTTKEKISGIIEENCTKEKILK